MITIIMFFIFIGSIISLIYGVAAKTLQETKNPYSPRLEHINRQLTFQKILALISGIWTLNAIITVIGSFLG